MRESQGSHPTLRSLRRGRGGKPHPQGTLSDDVFAQACAVPNQIVAGAAAADAPDALPRVFAPHSRLRAAITPAGQGAPR